MSRNCEQVTMPAGTYYVGDLCYVMHPEWNEFCDLTISGNQCLNGKFTLRDGRQFVTLQTWYGDGCYHASNGAELGVDAGLIGCIRVCDIRDPEMMESGRVSEDNLKSAGTIVTFDTDFVCHSTEGNLVFGNLVVDTRQEEDFFDEANEYEEEMEDE